MPKKFDLTNEARSEIALALRNLKMSAWNARAEVNRYFKQTDELYRNLDQTYKQIEDTIKAAEVNNGIPIQHGNSRQP